MSYHLASLDEEIAELKANFANKLAELEAHRPQLIAEAIAEEEAKAAAASARAAALRASLAPTAHVPLQPTAHVPLQPAPTAPAVAEEPKPKQKRTVSPGTLAWAAFVRHIKATMPERFVGIKKQCEMLVIAKAIKQGNMEAYLDFVEQFKTAHQPQQEAAV